ncbi:MAG TPA: diguanylate cyclase [Candidatus Wunengus sp. YC60]|uniref:diguanylate cyclase n=1 Tax=Candidatus Wunengus sp. YC60 TaxID=3367697 RepID=UPI004027152E
MNLFKNLSISKKLLIILLLVSILPLFIITCGFYTLVKTRLTEQTKHILKVQSEDVAVAINRYTNYKFKHLYKIADMPQLIYVLRNVEHRPHIPDRIISSLQTQLRIDPDFLSFSVMDAKGNVVLSTGDIVNINFGNRLFFSEAIKGERYVSAPSLDEGKPSIYFSIPMRCEGKVVGVLAAQCKAEELWELIKTENGRVGQGNLVILSNSDGVRIAHSTNKDLIFKSWATLTPEVREQILKEERYGSDIKEISSTDKPEVMNVVTKESPQQYFWHELDIGTVTYHSALKVMDNGWRIISTIPESTFLVPVSTGIFHIGIISAIIACVVIVASIVIGRLSTKRIQIFASISKEIAGGNFTNEVPFTDGDEIGQLGKAFNIMVTSIRRKIEQLKYLNDVAVDIHSHIEIGHLLQDIINISRRVVSAEMGVLTILDKDLKKIKYFKVSIPNLSEPCEIHDLPKGKGLLLSAVARKGKMLRLNNIMEDPRSIGLPPNQPQIRTLLGVPLVISDGIMCGEIFLANKANNEQFTLEDEEILLTITYQASVAIENARLYEQVQLLAITDGLTGLINHREFHKKLDESIEVLKRYNYTISLLMIDIDHFKQFNDTYGHQVGDQVLRIVADVIKLQIRVVDICARYGGEEFAVILRDSVTSQPLILAERIRSTVYAYPFKHDGVISQLSVSIGVACFPADADNAEDLIKNADEALYTAKRTGRNKICFYTKLNSQEKPNS